VPILNLSKDLKLRFISSDATASFRPHPANLDQPIEAADGLMAVDPGLSLNCRSVLRSGRTVVSLRLSRSDGYMECLLDVHHW